MKKAFFTQILGVMLLIGLFGHQLIAQSVQSEDYTLKAYSLSELPQADPWKAMNDSSLLGFYSDNSIERLEQFQDNQIQNSPYRTDRSEWVQGKYPEGIDGQTTVFLRVPNSEFTFAGQHHEEKSSIVFIPVKTGPEAPDSDSEAKISAWWWLLLLIPLALLALYIAWRREIAKDPVASGEPMIQGGLTPGNVRQFMEQSGVRIVGDIQSGTMYGTGPNSTALVAYADKRKPQPRTVDGLCGYRALAEKSNGSREWVHFAEGCGNSVTYGGWWYTGIRFEPDAEQDEALKAEPIAEAEEHIIEAVSHQFDADEYINLLLHPAFSGVSPQMKALMIADMANGIMPEGYSLAVFTSKGPLQLAVPPGLPSPNGRNPFRLEKEAKK